MGLYEIPTGIALCFEWENMTTWFYSYYSLRSITIPVPIPVPL